MWPGGVRAARFSNEPKLSKCDRQGAQGGYDCWRSGGYDCQHKPNNYEDAVRNHSKRDLIHGIHRGPP